VIYGFTVWLKASREEKPDVEPQPRDAVRA
jgi:hypothetical protein